MFLTQFPSSARGREVDEIVMKVRMFPIFASVTLQSVAVFIYRYTRCSLDFLNKPLESSVHLVVLIEVSKQSFREEAHMQ